MKRQFVLALVVTLSVLLSLVSLPSVTHGQQRPGFKADLGVVSPGVGQIFRVTVANKAGTETSRIRFASIKYGSPAGNCNNDGVCRHVVIAQSETAPVTLDGADAASFDVQGNGMGTRVIVFASVRDVQITAQLINPDGEVSSFLINVEALP